MQLAAGPVRRLPMGATQLLVAVCLLYLVAQTAAQAATLAPTTAAPVVAIPVLWVALRTRRPHLPAILATAVTPAPTAVTVVPAPAALAPRLAGLVVIQPVVRALPMAVRVPLDQAVPVEQ